MMSTLMATLVKELREALRDKRTLFLTLVLPLAFYPALVLLSSKPASELEHSRSERAEGGQAFTVSVVGSQSLEHLLLGEFELLGAERADVRLQASESMVAAHPQWIIRIEAEDELKKQAVTRRLVALSEELLAERIAGLGWAEHPLQVIGGADTLAGDRQQVGEKGMSMQEVAGFAAYFLIFLAFTGCMAVAVDTAAGEKERGTLESLMVTPAPMMAVLMGKWLYVIAMGLCSVLATLAGISAVALLSEGASSVEMHWPASLGMFGILVLTVGFFASLLLLLSLTAKTSKEAHLKSSLLMLLVALLLISAKMPASGESWWLYLVPVMNVSLVIQHLAMGNLQVWMWLSAASQITVLSLLVLQYTSWRVRRNPGKWLLK